MGEFRKCLLFTAVQIVILFVFMTVFIYTIPVHYKNRLPDSTVTRETRDNFKPSIGKTSDKDWRSQTKNASHLFHLDKQPFQAHSPIRLLCLILTQPKSLKDKAQAVFDTWGSRCTFLYFLSTKTNLDEHKLPVLHSPKKENYKNLWSKTKYGFKFAFDHMLEQVDWVLKGDDDTYVIMENLHNMLAAYDPEQPYYFGCHYDVLVKNGYMSGGAGYVLSKKAVEMLVPVLDNDSYCRTDDKGDEDVEMGKCLSNLGITPTDSRDQQNNKEERFLHLDLWRMMGKAQLGFACCSKDVISFHYIKPKTMYEMDFLLYKVRIADLKTVEKTSLTRLKRSEKNSSSSSTNSEISTANYSSSVL